MDQDTTESFYDEEDAATLYILDCPLNVTMILDQHKTWIKGGSSIIGVKIPPGLHYIYYIYISWRLDVTRRGFFHRFKKSEVLVKRWNKKTGQIDTRNVSEKEVLRARNSQVELNRILKVKDVTAWNELTKYMSGMVTCML